MDNGTIIWIAGLMAIAAALYSSVGHGGASAYLAIMALFSVAPEAMRPTALALNLVVATFAAGRFALERQTNWRLLTAFAVTAVPAAYLGGRIILAPELYRPLVGVVLLLAAVRLFWQPERLAGRALHTPSPLVTLPVGAVLGLLAGLSGTGGGIFLSPLIILFKWEDARKTSGIAAAFIVSIIRPPNASCFATSAESEPTEVAIPDPFTQIVVEQSASGGPLPPRGTH